MLSAALRLRSQKYAAIPMPARAMPLESAISISSVPVSAGACSAGASWISWADAGCRAPSRPASTAVAGTWLAARASKLGSRNDSMRLLPPSACGTPT